MRVVLLAFLASLGLTLVLIETLLFRSAKRVRVARLQSKASLYGPSCVGQPAAAISPA
jgi:hypothetical protein